MMNNNSPAILFEPNKQQEESWSILCDFDGTISLNDVTDTLLTQFGKAGYEDLEQAWEAGEIGSRECMGSQIALLNMSKTELDAALDSIEIDSHFKSFIAHAKKIDIPVAIVSDGLDYTIQRILNNNGITGIPIYANQLVHINERQWKLEFPYASQNCIKASGNCKCKQVMTQQNVYKKVLFVGDGSSDFCASGKVDFVLAK